jgi:hypothetical protein
MSTDYQVHGKQPLSLNNPPVNGLDYATRQPLEGL